ncbi:MAG: hypothetical protein RIQ43_975, partial [Pseudomonadota bacterium]
IQNASFEEFSDLFLGNFLLKRCCLLSLFGQFTLAFLMLGS